MTRYFARALPNGYGVADAAIDEVIRQARGAVYDGPGIYYQCPGCSPGGFCFADDFHSHLLNCEHFATFVARMLKAESC